MPERIYGPYGIPGLGTPYPGMGGDNTRNTREEPADLQELLDAIAAQQGYQFGINPGTGKPFEQKHLDKYAAVNPAWAADGKITPDEWAQYQLAQPDSRWKEGWAADEANQQKLFDAVMSGMSTVSPALQQQLSGLLGQHYPDMQFKDSFGVGTNYEAPQNYGTNPGTGKEFNQSVIDRYNAQNPNWDVNGNNQIDPEEWAQYQLSSPTERWADPSTQQAYYDAIVSGLPSVSAGTQDQLKNLLAENFSSLRFQDSFGTGTLPGWQDPGYIGGNYLISQPGDFGALVYNTDSGEYDWQTDPANHIGLAGPNAADEIIPADVLAVYDSLIKNLAESGVDLSQIDFGGLDGGLGAAAQMLQANIDSGLVDPSLIGQDVYDALDMEGVVPDGTDYDFTVIDETIDGSLDDILNGTVDDAVDGENVWKDNGADLGDWRWYDHDDDPNTPNVFGPPAGVDGETDNTGNSGGNAGNSGGQSGTWSQNDNDGWKFNVPTWLGGILGGNSDGGDNVGFGDLLEAGWNTIVEGDEFDFDFGGMFGDMGNTLINAGISNYVADKFKESQQDWINHLNTTYQNQVNRTDPYNQLGQRNLDNLYWEGQTTPARTNPFEGRFWLNPDTNVASPGVPTAGNTNVSASLPQARELQGTSLSYGAMPQNVNAVASSYQAPRVNNIGSDVNINPAQAREVAVNQTNLLDPNNPYLQAMQRESSRAISDAGVAAGKFKSGDTMRALNDATMSNYARILPTLQGIESSRDQMNLASDAQRFGQAQAGQGFMLNRDLANVDNRFRADAQRFGQQSANNQFNLGQDEANFGRAMNAANQNFQNQLAGQRFMADQDVQNFQTGLAADAQRFGQQTGQAGLSLQQQQQNIQNRLAQENQRFNQGLQNAGFQRDQANNNFSNRLIANEQGFNQRQADNAQRMMLDEQRFQQLLAQANLGQTAASGSSALAGTLMGQMGYPLGNMGNMAGLNAMNRGNIFNQLWG